MRNRVNVSFVCAKRNDFSLFLEVSVMRRFITLLAVLILTGGAIVNADEPTVSEVTHTEFQAVDATGEQFKR